MTHLPKIGHENILFECKEQKSHQSDNVMFDKTLKSYVMKVGPTNLYSYHNTYDLNVKGSKIYIQVYLMEKLKFLLELQSKEDYFRIVVNPNLQQAYIKKADEVKISSAFILTNKWISLSFDVESFFKSNELQLKMISIHSQCRLRKIYEANQITSINDGQCLVQKICEKRILELLPSSLRAQSEKIDIRKNQIISQQRRLSTISNSQEKNQQTQSEKKSIQFKQTNINLQDQNKQINLGIKGKSTQIVQNQVQKKYIQQNPQKQQLTRKQVQQNLIVQQQQQFQQPPQPLQLSSNRSKNISSAGLQKQISQECLLEKTIKLATGLQVIEEVNSNKPPIYNKQNSTKQAAQTQLQKKAVQSFLRHTQEFQNQSHFSHDTVNDAKTENEQGHKQSQLSSGVKELYYDYDNSEYQTKYGKFSSTFTRPLGLSSYNHRLVSQQSTNQQPGSTNEYFYLSSQQIEQQNQSPNQTANEIEEQIEVPELRSKMTEDSFNSLNGLQIKQEDSSEELAVSKFE